MIILLLFLWLIPAAITLILSMFDVSRLFSFYRFSSENIRIMFIPILNWVTLILYIIDSFDDSTIAYYSGTYKDTMNVHVGTLDRRIRCISHLDEGDIVTIYQGYNGFLYERLAKVTKNEITEYGRKIHFNGKWESFTIHTIKEEHNIPNNEKEEGEQSMDFAFDEELEIKEVDGIPFFIDDGKIHNIPEDVLEKINEFKKKGKKIVLSKHTYSDGEVDFMVEAKL